MTRPRWTREPTAMRRALVRPVHVITIPRSAFAVDPEVGERMVVAYSRRLDHFEPGGDCTMRLRTDQEQDVERVTITVPGPFPLKRRRQRGEHAPRRYWNVAPLIPDPEWVKRLSRRADK